MANRTGVLNEFSMWWLSFTMENWNCWAIKNQKLSNKCSSKLATCLAAIQVAIDSLCACWRLLLLRSTPFLLAVVHKGPRYTCIEYAYTCSAHIPAQPQAFLYIGLLIYIYKQRTHSPIPCTHAHQSMTITQQKNKHRQSHKTKWCTKLLLLCLQTWLALSPFLWVAWHCQFTLV